MEVRGEGWGVVEERGGALPLVHAPCHLHTTSDVPQPTHTIKTIKKLYHTTFFFTIPLPKQIKKVVITTKIPVKQPQLAGGGVHADPRIMPRIK